MNNYGFNIPNNNINIIDWAHRVNARNDAKAKESRDNMMNTMKMLGLAAAAYKGNPTMSQSAEDYYNDNWSSYSPEDQVSLVSMGFNPSLYNGMNPTLNENDIWGE